VTTIHVGRNSQITQSLYAMAKWNKREKLMTARGRWAIGGSAMVVVIVAAAFLGTTRNRNSVQARGYLLKALSRLLRLPPPKGRGSFGNHAGRRCCRWRPKGRLRERRSVCKKRTLLGEIACDELQAILQTAIAEADVARQTRTRILRGARDEEKK